jgi:hypothetical protein
VVVGAGVAAAGGVALDGMESESSEPASTPMVLGASAASSWSMIAPDRSRITATVWASPPGGYSTKVWVAAAGTGWSPAVAAGRPSARRAAVVLAAR